jgi:hypothetical protein
MDRWHKILPWFLRPNSIFNLLQGPNLYGIPLFGAAPTLSVAVGGERGGGLSGWYLGGDGVGINRKYLYEMQVYTLYILYIQYGRPRSV